MKKKLLMILLCVALVASALAGCQSNIASNDNTEETTNNEVETNQASETGTEQAVVETTESDDSRQVFVNAEYIKNVIDGDNDNYVIIEASWGAAEVNETYQATHIPGAVHMNTDSIEEPVYWNIRSGEEITEVMKNYGITKDTLVIVYGNDSGAARFAFVSLWAGVENVKLLDGGLKAWLSAGYETEEGIIEPVATTEEFGLTIPAHPEYVLAMPADAQEQLDNNDNFRLVSIRTEEEFKGETSGYSYIPEAGEPQGALWGHDEFDYYNEDGTVISIEAAQALWNEQNIDKENNIAFYCGTGWRATVPFLLAYENGWDSIQLYDGGWFAWQMDAANPVQTITPEEAANKYE